MFRPFVLVSLFLLAVSRLPVLFFSLVLLEHEYIDSIRWGVQQTMFSHLDLVDVSPVIKVGLTVLVDHSGKLFKKTKCTIKDVIVNQEDVGCGAHIILTIRWKYSGGIVFNPPQKTS